MTGRPDELPVHLFSGPAEMDSWLEEHHESAGVWLKIAPIAERTCPRYAGTSAFGSLHSAAWIVSC